MVVNFSQAQLLLMEDSAVALHCFLVNFCSLMKLWEQVSIRLEGIFSLEADILESLEVLVYLELF